MRRRTTEGMSKAEVIRCLKRYVAREVFSILRDSAYPTQVPHLSKRKTSLEPAVKRAKMVC